ncbi:MAG: hypothetical protein H5T72_08315 [Actinobacteria bacterium]|nr:hypothetical protein [Actinomycetota bacterium]
MHLHGPPREVLGSERLREVYRCEFDFLAGAGYGTPSGKSGAEGSRAGDVGRHHLRSPR